VSSPGAPRAGRRRYAIVGTGQRASNMWGSDVKRDYDDVIEFVGLCDPNLARAQAARQLMGVDCPLYQSFDVMLREAKPELVAVMTVDARHAEHIVQALDHGLDVISEKPMVIDEAQCRAVLEAERRSGKKIAVTFNYRYAPRHQRIKEILLSGELGRVVAVAFDWQLDVEHGADYFRRWHRRRESSGSLLVHKATHHFDLINWWLDTAPVEVMAHGALAHYGKNGPFRHSHCRPCPHQHECKFHFDLARDPQASLFIGPDEVDGYHRDGCVFREDIDIFDSMSALVKYDNGAVMNYSLNAFMPYEGYRLTFTCERGTLDARLIERVPGGDRMEIVVTRSFDQGRPHVEHPAHGPGHGGGDQRLRDQIFRGAVPPAHLALPGSRAGALSCLTGIAARRSIDERRPVRIDELVRL
jgi:predicted dehydrogenase